MPLSSASTRAQVVAAYDDNSDYESDGTGAKAAAFAQACRIMLRLPERSRGALGEAQFSHSSVRMQLDKAEAFLASVQGDLLTQLPQSTPRQFSMERFDR